MFSGGLVKTRRERARRWAAYSALAVATVVVILSADWALVSEKMLNPGIAAEQFPQILTVAARNTLIFTAVSFFFGFAIALVMALMRLSPVKAYRIMASIYIEALRGLPLLVTIILIGLGLPLAIPAVRGLPVFWRGVIALALVTGAYMAETIRAGIESVPPGQAEAARSLGMTRAQTTRWIILPQALRTIIPPLTNEFVILIKDTSLISALGVTAGTIELTRWGRNGVVTNANATALILAGVIYLALTIPLTQIARRLEAQGERR